MHIGIETDREGAQDGIYSSPVLPNSRCPGLLGRRAMRDNRMLIDTYRNKVYMVGPGGYKLQLSTGSRILNTMDSTAGHMLLPCSQFPPSPTRTDDMITFAVDEAPPSSEAAPPSS